MKVIPLTRGLFAKVDDADYEMLFNFGKWCALVQGNKAYAVTSKAGKIIRMHRLLVQGRCIDHVDGDGLNNQRKNIRSATWQQNLANSIPRRSNKSGRKGVHWDRKNNKWRASIGVNHKCLQLGRFSDLESASKAYDYAALRYFGDFAKTNAMMTAEKMSSPVDLFRLDSENKSCQTPGV